MFREVINDTQNVMDLAFVAGTIATSTGVARSDAVQYAEKLLLKQQLIILRLGSKNQWIRLVI